MQRSSPAFNQLGSFLHWHCCHPDPPRLHIARAPRQPDGASRAFRSDQVERHFARHPLAARIHFPGILPERGTSADRHRGSVRLRDELLSAQAVVAFRPADLEGARAVDQPVDAGQRFEFAGLDISRVTASHASRTARVSAIHSTPGR